MSAMDEIRAASRGIGEKVNAKDAGAAADYYTDDGKAQPSGSPEVSGKAAVRAFWQSMIDAGMSDTAINPVEIEILGSHAIDRGTFTAKLGDQDLAGKYMIWWKQTDAGWRAYNDIFNFDA